MKNQGEEGGVSVEVENLVTELMENLDQFVLDPAPQVFLSNIIIILIIIWDIWDIIIIYRELSLNAE